MIVLITFGTWYMATGDRAAEFSKGKTAIEGSFSQVGQVTAFKDHPNDNYIKALELRVGGDVANAPEEVKRIAAVTAATESLMGNVSKAAAPAIRRPACDLQTAAGLPQQSGGTGPLRG